MKQYIGMSAAVCLNICISAAPVKAETAAELSQLDHTVRMLCNNELAFTNVVKIEGDGGLGGRLRLLGVGLGGEVSVSQFENLHNLYDGTRYNPTKCRIDMVGALSKVFFTNTASTSSGVGERGASGNSSGSDGSNYSSQAGPNSSGGANSTPRGSTSCFSDTNNPSCVAEFSK